MAIRKYFLQLKRHLDIDIRVQTHIMQTNGHTDIQNGWNKEVDATFCNLDVKQVFRLIDRQLDLNTHR